jgi:hypothetical protein
MTAWTCADCGKRLRSHWAHCPCCCLTFAGTSPFDAHLKSLVNAGCRPESELETLTVKKTGARRLMARDIDGIRVWQAWSELAVSAPHDGDSGAFGKRVAATS